MSENAGNKPFAEEVEPIALRIVRFHTNVEWQPEDYVTDEDHIQLPDYAGTAPEGATFVGWNYNGQVFQPGQTIHFHNDIAFDAEYDYKGLNREKLQKFDTNGSVAVFSLKDSRVRSILSSIDPDDLMSSYHDGKPLIIPCTALVVIDRAWLEQQYDEKAHRYNDVMKITGSVREVFIESPDENFKFPCGTKRMTLHQAYPVEWTYIPSCEEYAVLHQRGLSRGDLKAPATMVRGAMVEFPVTITYDAIYDSPVAVVSILNNFSLKTTSFESGYDTMFEATPQSKIYAEELARGMQSQHQMTDNQIAMDYMLQMSQDEVAEQYNMVDRPKEEAVVEDTPEEAEEVDRFTRESEASTLAKLRQASEKMNNISMTHDSAIYGNVVERLEAQRQEKIGQIAYGRAESHETIEKEVDGIEPTYGDWLRELGELAAEGQREVKMSDTDNDAQALKDLKMLEEMLKNPEANIAEMTGMNAVHDAAEKRKTQQKNLQAQQAANQYDVAQDNKALNAGNTDIAGHGATEMPADVPKAKKQGAVGAFLSGVKGNTIASQPDAPGTTPGSQTDKGTQYM